MTIDEMKRKKNELGYSYAQIAEMADLPVGTVQKVLGGITKSPRYATLQALQKVFDDGFGAGSERGPGSPEPDRGSEYTPGASGACGGAGRPVPKHTYNYDHAGLTSAGFVAEPAMAYGTRPDSFAAESAHDTRSDFFTVADYLALPEDRHMELIDGIFYDMAAPTHIHQMIATEIWRCFSEYIRSRHGSCRPMVAPLDVQLDCDDRTMVQPDVLILCDPDKIRHGRICGAPDLVVEVLSEATALKDSHLKRFKYARAGVREYWLVYPKEKKIVVYCFEEDTIPKIYGFSDRVPVGIYQGECTVDFAEIEEYIGDWYERL
ncbi:MAG: Uma2 family endonuclease [Lachnospiraceae bacterium]|nr:Uma2 family endonuclease [Lachnospiraceae bacterium]MCD7765098.1 Uma2 family endonuclease [Lachnospiraceae bacterium]